MRPQPMHAFGAQSARTRGNHCITCTIIILRTHSGQNSCLLNLIDSHFVNSKCLRPFSTRFFYALHVEKVLRMKVNWKYSATSASGALLVQQCQLLAVARTLV